jgi:hypothetical protein
MGEAGSAKVRFSSMLRASYRDHVEGIVFSNPEQARGTELLLASVKRYGVPAIVEDGPLLRFALPAFQGVQSLYALDESEEPARLAGVAMFAREAPDTIVIFHLAVDPEYLASGGKAGAWVGARLISTVRAICLRTRGVTSLRVLYPREKVFHLRPAT